jgi:hypothetical protein
LLKTRTGDTSMMVPAGIGREAKTPRPERMNQGVSQNQVTSAEGYITWRRPLAVLEMRTSPSVLSSGVPWSSDNLLMPHWVCGNKKVMNNLSRVLSDIVAHSLSTTCKTLEREAVRPFAGLNFSPSR